MHANNIGAAFRWLAAAMTMAFSAAPALAQKPAALFDKPVSIKTLQTKNDAPKVICSSYADVMVRETQDGPTSENAVLVHGANARCEARAPAGVASIETEGLYLLGRKGDRLVFSAMDPNGAVDFVVVDARSGKIVLKDATYGSPDFKSTKASGGTTTLAYRRGVNAPCALPSGGARCWASLVDSGKIPDSLARPTPDPSLCAASYRRAKSPKDNPSIIAFDVETSIDAAGKVATVVTGKASCDPTP